MYVGGDRNCDPSNSIFSSNFIFKDLLKTLSNVQSTQHENIFCSPTNTHIFNYPYIHIIFMIWTLQIANMQIIHVRPLLEVIRPYYQLKSQHSIAAGSLDFGTTIILWFQKDGS